MSAEWWPKPQPRFGLFPDNFRDTYELGYTEGVQAAMRAVAERMRIRGCKVSFDFGFSPPLDDRENRYNRQWLGLEGAS